VRPGIEPAIESADARVLPFRRRRTSPRRRRRSVWVRLLLPVGGALAAILVPAALTLWILRSPRFALADFDVQGGRRVSAEWMRAALGPLAGRNLPTLQLEEVEERLLRHGWIASFEARKRLPRGLVVRIRERVPVAMLVEGTRLSYIDREGALIAPVEPASLIESNESGEGAPRLFFVRAGAGTQVGIRRALAVAGEIERADAQWSQGLSEIEALSEDDFRVVTASLPFPVLVKSGVVELGARRLRTLLPEIRRRYGRVEAVDLRWPRRVIIQPAPIEAPPVGGASASAMAPAA
jgi:cell division septal protein FtsQ